MNTTVELSNDYGVYFKPGYLLSPTILVYGKFGAIWANEKITNTAQYNQNLTNVFIQQDPFADLGSITEQGAASGSSSNNKTKLAFLLGGGVESFIFPQWFNNHVTLSADYTWANFGHVTTTTTISGLASATATELDNPAQTLSTPITVNFGNYRSNT